MGQFRVYTVAKTNELLNNKTDKANMPTGKTVTDTVTFQDLIDMGFVNPPS